MKVAEKQAGGDARRRRPEPGRTGPDRSGPAGKKPSPKAAQSAQSADEEARPADGAPNDFGVRRIVADAVQLGYDVVADNLALGRAAADRFSAGAYGLDHAKDDVGELSKRLVQLTRDLGVVWFDLLEAAVRDPTLREALKPRPRPNPNRPAPGGDAPGKPLASVGCQVKGNDRASASPFLLSQPEGPARLAVAGLHSPNRSLPPITKVTFVAGKDPNSIVAMIGVPADQPAGVYNGTVCDYDTHAPLGTLTVRVKT